MRILSYIKRGVRFILSGVPEKNITAAISYSSPNERLLGKKVIVTGGGRGLGAAMARCFVKEGAEVLIAGRNEKTLQEVSTEIGCKYLVLDVSDVNSFKQFFDNANKILGGINVLVNNAGISLHEDSFFDVTPETFDSQFNTNVKGGFFLTQEFVKLLKVEKRKGNVLFVSSETGDTVDFRPYGFTKVTVNSIVQGLAYLFAKDGIRINAVAPGITSSDMTGIKSDGNLYLPINLNERVYLPEEVAEISCFLISDVSGCLSGQIVTCNNGRTINARWK